MRKWTLFNDNTIELLFEWIFRFRLQEDELSLAVIQILPLKRTHGEPSFQWSSHLFGFRLQ